MKTSASDVNPVFLNQPKLMSENVRTNRLNWVDYARGIAILLVVYRHVVYGFRRSNIVISDFMFNIQDVFFNFRMPVFFILSGIFIANSLKRRSTAAVIRDRASTLLYPYFLWALVNILLQIFFSGFSNAKRDWHDLSLIVMQPREIGPIWYLLALFNTSMLYILVSQVLKNRWVHLLFALAVHFISLIPALRDYSLLTDMLNFYPFFVIGTFASETVLSPEKSARSFKLHNLFWLLPLFVAGQWFWFMNKEVFHPWYLPAYFIIMLVGCYFIMLVAYNIQGYRSTAWLAFLGKYALYIYILHFYLVAISRLIMIRFFPGVNIWFVALVGVISGLCIPIVLYRLIRPFGGDWLFSLKPPKTSLKPATVSINSRTNA